MEKISSGIDAEKPAERLELTKAMQNYLDLHRHSAVRLELLNHSDIALRLAVAQMIAGSELWTIHADPQKANTDVIADSLATNKAEGKFGDERQIVRELLDMEENDKINTIVKSRAGWGTYHDLPDIFAKLLKLDDETVARILSYVVAETLTCSSPMVEILGNMLSVDMSEHWQEDETFLALVRFEKGEGRAQAPRVIYSDIVLGVSLQ